MRNISLCFSNCHHGIRAHCCNDLRHSLHQGPSPLPTPDTAHQPIQRPRPRPGPAPAVAPPLHSGGNSPHEERGNCGDGAGTAGKLLPSGGHKLQGFHREAVPGASEDVPREHEADCGEEHAGVQGPGGNPLGDAQTLHEGHECLALRPHRGDPFRHQTLPGLPEGEEARGQRLHRRRFRRQVLRPRRIQEARDFAHARRDLCHSLGRSQEPFFRPRRHPSGSCQRSSTASQGSY